MLICEKLELTQGTFQLSADVRFAASDHCRDWSVWCR